MSRRRTTKRNRDIFTGRVTRPSSAAATESPVMHQRAYGYESPETVQRAVVPKPPETEKRVEPP
jgi:hypothetical protein